MDKVEGEVGGHIGELGHAFDDFAQGRRAAQVADDQGGHDALAKLAQDALQMLVGGRRCAGKKVAHLRCAERPRRVLSEPGSDLRAAGEQIAQVAAVRPGGRPGGVQHAWIGGAGIDRGVHHSLFLGRPGSGQRGRR